MKLLKSQKRGIADNIDTVHCSFCHNHEDGTLSSGDTERTIMFNRREELAGHL